MRDVKIQVLREAVHALSPELEDNSEVAVQEHFLTGKGQDWLEEVFRALGGKGRAPLLKKLKFDLKIGRNVFLYDDEVHFNRYRLETLRSRVYEEMTFEWIAAHKRLCRTYEKAA
ncbi:hypothetical protein A3SI_06459 [Nitritalea halalkaliphila LW7]|uniref:Uncharacterized protein n=1 Tax=Nitritalea halalkaliphila LW7 TaxID=1189621 RepID=I5C6X5_9BACT|nr:hypothetical protein [Nitritalea halalkaliphila]EIM77577.1 hypothetical protein A3SI_06459 [Nitritalea halalkaliphila LW7]